MGAEAKDPEQIVKDGVDPGTGTVARGDAGGTSGPQPSHQDTAPGADASGNTRKVPGPAEEQDAETHDDRGLTTDASAD